MSLNIKINGLDKLTKLTGNAQKNLVKEIALGIRESAFILEAGAKQALTIGETRAIDTGRLRSDTIVRQITPLFATIAPLVDYAIYVHEGTRYMSERPFLEKGIKISKDRVHDIFKKRISNIFA